MNRANPLCAGPKPAQHPPAVAPANAPTTPRVIDSEEVLRGQATVVIAHRGHYYRLQSTRQGKLILTK